MAKAPKATANVGAILNDAAISKLTASTPPLVSEIDPTDFLEKKSPIQACSVDLSVGQIFRPKNPSWFAKLGWSSQDPGEWEITLKQGQTAIIRTREKLSLPNDISGFAFSPAHVSTKGLLMTNAGHVDPGYEGYLHLTVINMGKKDYVIRSGDRLVSVIFFQLTQAATRGWLDRRGGAALNETNFVATAQNRLSIDFLSIEDRARAEASKAVTKMTLWQFVLPVVASLGATFVAISLYAKQNSDAIARLEGRIAGIGANVNLQSVDERLTKLEKK